MLYHITSECIYLTKASENFHIINFFSFAYYWFSMISVRIVNFDMRIYLLTFFTILLSNYLYAECSA